MDCKLPPVYALRSNARSTFPMEKNLSVAPCFVNTDTIKKADNIVVLWKHIVENY